jgi:hypothetical protein
MLSKQLLDILACPKCKGKLLYEEKRSRLACKKCRLRYTIEDDVPNMVIE